MLTHNRKGRDYKEEMKSKPFVKRKRSPLGEDSNKIEEVKLYPNGEIQSEEKCKVILIILRQ